MTSPTISGSDCIFMGNVLTAECGIIDRHINEPQ